MTERLRLALQDIALPVGAWVIALVAVGTPISLVVWLIQIAVQMWG